MPIPISRPINPYQEQFNAICAAGGGPRGGPTRGKVQALLREAGLALNDHAYDDVSEALSARPEANPWHVCFALGLVWGEMANFSDDFIDAAVGCIEAWNDEDRRMARACCTQKGGDLVEGSLRSAFTMFQNVRRFPDDIPDTLDGLIKAQNAWFRALAQLEPTYIGPWNSTALFMVALFAKPTMAKAMKTIGPILPPGGPISRALRLLYDVGTTNLPPQSLDDDTRLSSLAAATADNGTMQDLLRGLDGCSMVDMHSGLYMLGTRDPRSATLFERS